ncbi:HAD-IIA family hydrolase [Dethiothermospora halolimnae]|uniref:HAD-IIA family hydrolase n=1 Tax=Dethiothermospora halolimnae TaxID=3114390 RepID=UPI003CCB8A5A
MDFKPKGFLIDLDGTVYLKEKEIEGSFKFIKKLQESNIPHRFLTNTTGRTIKEIKENLLKMGMDTKEENILNPIVIADYYLKENNIKFFCFAGEKKIGEQLKSSLQTDTNPEVVILGDIQKCCSYEELNKIYGYLMNGSKLISTSYSEFYISKDGRKIDTGAFAKLFENLTDEKAVIIGKPSNMFYQMALNSLGFSKDEVIAVGDDIKTDIKGAKAQGIYSVLVKTGKYDPDSLSKAEIKPDKILDRLEDLIYFL